MSYQPDFIPGFGVPLPNLNPRVADDALNEGSPVDHSRFSLVFHQARGFAIYTAHNIDGATMLPEGTIARVDKFRPDPQVTPEELQVNDARGYQNNPWDRGHLVRRSSLHWGEETQARTADDESFVWTNIAPQHHRLHSSAWGKIERWMLDRISEAHQQACVFTGPVFTLDDPEVDNQLGEPPFLLPAGFWKIVAIRDGNRCLAAGFLVWQRDYDSDQPVAFNPTLEQVRITTIEHLTGLGFPSLRMADPLLFTRTGRALIPRMVPPTPAPRGSTPINRAQDLIL
jgi:endonuclease G, mitochondrial